MAFSFLEIAAIFPHLRKLFSPEGREIMEIGLNSLVLHYIHTSNYWGDHDIQEKLLGTREGTNDLR